MSLNNNIDFWNVNTTNSTDCLWNHLFAHYLSLCYHREKYCNFISQLCVFNSYSHRPTAVCSSTSHVWRKKKNLRTDIRWIHNRILTEFSSSLAHFVWPRQELRLWRRTYCNHKDLIKFISKLWLSLWLCVSRERVLIIIRTIFDENYSNLIPPPWNDTNTLAARLCAHLTHAWDN